LAGLVRRLPRLPCLRCRSAGLARGLLRGAQIGGRVGLAARCRRNRCGGWRGAARLNARPGTWRDGRARPRGARLDRLQPASHLLELAAKIRNDRRGGLIAAGWRLRHCGRGGKAAAADRGGDPQPPRANHRAEAWPAATPCW